MGKKGDGRNENSCGQVLLALSPSLSLSLRSMLWRRALELSFCYSIVLWLLSRSNIDQHRQGIFKEKRRATEKQTSREDGEKLEDRDERDVYRCSCKVDVLGAE